MTAGGELVLTARRIHNGREMLDYGTVVIERSAGRVSRISQEVAPARAIDLGDRIVAPGFVDLHVHGGGGAEVNGDDRDAVAEAVAVLCRHHAEHGTTTLVATTVSDTPERLSATLAGVAAAADRSVSDAARVAGSHLEGPFLSPKRAGAQDPACIRAPDLEELEDLITAAAGTLRLVTLAPELPGGLELIERATRAGVTVALGHSEADFDTAATAFRRGARHVTHLFNAMEPLHHRRPGIVGAALADPRATVELIADLEHVHPALLGLAARAAPGRIVAVTDAMAACGLGEGNWRLGSRRVSVSGSRVVLAADGETLAGSVLTMEVAVRNLSGPGCLGEDAALRAATGTPGGLLGDGAGWLEAGGLADLVVLEPDLTLAATLIGGRPVHDPTGLFA